MNIKKLTALALSGALSLTLLSGCGKKEGTTLKVGATPAPHAEILTVVKDILAKEVRVYIKRKAAGMSHKRDAVRGVGTVHFSVTSFNRTSASLLSL